MTNEPLGIYQKLRAMHRPLEDRERQRKRMLSIGAWNGVRAAPHSPFSPVVVRRLMNGGYHRHHPKHGNRRRPRYAEAQLDITLAQVVQAVCSEADITHDELFSQSRKRRFAYPRHVCLYMIDRYCPEYSLHEVSRIFKRDHTTVLYGIEMTEQRLLLKPGTRDMVISIHQRLVAIASGGPLND